MNNLAVYFFITSFCLSGLLIFLLYKSPLRKYFADSPDHRKVHQQIVPRIGGMGLILSFLIMIIFWFHGLKSGTMLAPQYFSFLVFISLFLLVAGSLDDVKSLDYKTKFMLQFIFAGVIVTVFNVKFETLHILDMTFSLGLFSSMASIFWLMGVMNAFNIIDGIDGLAAAIAFISFITVGILANAKLAAELVVLCAILTGITAGFLPFNILYQKTKTFLGDTGSLFLGAMLGVLCIEVTRLPDNEFSLLVPILIAGYPLFDITVAMIRRFRAQAIKDRRILGRRLLNMFEADNEHLHHRLVHWGLSHLQAVFLLSLVAVTMGSVAIIISRIALPLRLAVFAYLVLSLLLILNRLRYIGVRNWVHFPRAKPLHPRIVGLIEPDELFYHSIRKLEQRKLEFIQIPMALFHQFKSQFYAIVVYNASDENFHRDWHHALRVSEVYACPIFVIAAKEKIQSLHNRERFRSIFFVEKPVRIPELLETLEETVSSRSRHLRFDELSDLRIFSEEKRSTNVEPA